MKKFSEYIEVKLNNGESAKIEGEDYNIFLALIEQCGPDILMKNIKVKDLVKALESVSNHKSLPLYHGIYEGTARDALEEFRKESE